MTTCPPSSKKIIDTEEVYIQSPTYGYLSSPYSSPAFWDMSVGAQIEGVGKVEYFGVAHNFCYGNMKLNGKSEFFSFFPYYSPEDGPSEWYQRMKMTKEMCNSLREAIFSGSDVRIKGEVAQKTDSPERNTSIAIKTVEVLSAGPEMSPKVKVNLPIKIK